MLNMYPYNPISSYRLIKYVCELVTLALILCLPLTVASGPLDDAIPPLKYKLEQQAHSFVVRILFSESREPLIESVTVGTGPASGMHYGAKDLRVEYISSGVKKSFTIPNPLITRSWMLARNSQLAQDALSAGGHNLSGLQRLATLPSASVRIVLPFHSSVENLIVYDHTTNQRQVVVDLRPYVLSHCQLHPSSVSCDELVNSEIEVTEDCTRTPSAELQVVQINNSWKIVRGTRNIVSDFGALKQEAYDTLAILQRYNIDQVCYVGRPNPSMVYVKSGSEIPARISSDEDCIGFSRESVSVISEGERWLLRSAGSRMKMFPNESEAKMALHLIKKYKISQHCFVGRPYPSFEYWLSN